MRWVKKYEIYYFTFEIRINKHFEKDHEGV